MKIRLYLGLFAAIALSACTTNPAPVQIAFIHPLQIFPEDHDVQGLRLNLVHGKSANLTGLDIGVVNDAAEVTGLEIGALNLVRGDYTGLQLSGLTSVDGGFRGLQLCGFGFVAGPAEGLQLCGAAKADGFSGAQIGAIVQSTDTAMGLQLSALNSAMELTGLQAGVVGTAAVFEGLQLNLGANQVKQSFTGAQVGLVNVADGMD
ncbi:MAG: hypothetical protein JRG82_16015, partial [Deltaproteobacteria bacterium]|nr:hypothetical protein [Deltaproteobacteria bacterium]